MSYILEFSYDKIELNDQQYKLITDKHNDNKLILSCAGSGKTMIIIAKICYMIEYLNCKPEDFIVCTFNLFVFSRSNNFFYYFSLSYLYLIF